MIYGSTRLYLPGAQDARTDKGIDNRARYLCTPEAY
jgi:hypothetical protein